MFRLADLEQELIKEGKKGISFVIVNPSDKEDYLQFEDFKNGTKINVLQDTESLNLWNFYDAITDDMFIFDRYIRIKHFQVLIFLLKK